MQSEEDTLFFATGLEDKRIPQTLNPKPYVLETADLLPSFRVRQSWNGIHANAMTKTSKQMHEGLLQ